jgi:hypothetical protein
MVEMVITKITAPPMPTAVEVFFETPRNGQIPKNFARTILLMKMVEIIITRYSIIDQLMFYRFLSFHPGHNGNYKTECNKCARMKRKKPVKH